MTEEDELMRLARAPCLDDVDRYEPVIIHQRQRCRWYEIIWDITVVMLDVFRHAKENKGDSGAAVNYRYQKKYCGGSDVGGRNVLD